VTAFVVFLVAGFVVVTFLACVFVAVVCLVVVVFGVIAVVVFFSAVLYAGALVVLLELVTADFTGVLLFETSEEAANALVPAPITLIAVNNAATCLVHFFIIESPLVWICIKNNNQIGQFYEINM
jgi:hypothetical protein